MAARIATPAAPSATRPARIFMTNLGKLKVIVMRHAVILAHPKPASFCTSIAKTCVENLTSLGDQVILRDLYQLAFDPCLKAGELPTELGFGPGPDVVTERELLAHIDSLILVYPFWFNAPPAILKGYVDRVFCMGFGYGPAFGGTEPLLVGKRLTSFSTSGAPEYWVNSTGALKALMAVFDLHPGSAALPSRTTDILGRSSPT